MKKIIIIISCICTLAAIVALAYFIFMHQSIADYMEAAQKAMRAGDLKTAETNFIAVIKRDRGNETAYKALAEIAEKNKKLTWAASYWRIAAKLNPLSRELREKYIKALLATYQYSVIIERLNNKEISNLSDFELYALTKASYYKNPLIETEKLLAALIKRSPDSPKVILLHANVLLADRQPEEAAKLFATLSDCPDKEVRTDALLGLGYTDQIFKKPAKAGESYKKAVETSPDSMQALMVLANYSLSVGKQKEAKAQYQELYKRFPQNLIVVISLAEIYAKDKNASEIMTMLNHIEPDNKVAVAAKYYLRALLAYIENDPKKLQENLQLCRMFRSRPLYAFLDFPGILVTNNIPDIQRHVKVLLELNDSPTAKTDICRQLERLAAANFKKNDFQKAGELAVIMQELLPKKPEIAHLIMVCAFNLQDWRKAITAAEKFNELRPDTLDYLSIKGRSLLYLKDAGMAMPLLKKLTVLTPEKPEVWLWAAQAAQLLDKTKDVETYVDKMLATSKNSRPVINEAVAFFIDMNMKIAEKIARRLENSNDNSFRAMSLSIKAQAAIKNNKWQDAVKYLTEASDLDKSNDTLLYISDIYTQHKEYDRAMEYVSEALKSSPDDPKALYRQAVIYQELADYKQAIKIYEKLLEKYPQWSLVLINLSDIMALKGETRKALDLAQRAQEKAPLWIRGKLCLGLRELDSKNYTTALRILELVLIREPDNKTAKNAVARCLVPIIKKDIEDKSFAIARIRLTQLKTATPNLDEAAVLQELLTAKEKADKLSRGNN